MDQYLAYNGLTNIVAHLICFALTWYALGAIRIEAIMKPNHVIQIRLFYVILTLVLGSGLAEFLLGYFESARSLQFFF